MARSVGGWPAALLAVAMGSALALALAEITLRVLGIAFPIFYATDPCCGSVLRPGAAGWWTAEGHAYVAINSDGLRDVEHSRAKDPQRFRIAVIGDSYAEAKQIPLEETFFRVAARELERCDALPAPSAEPINFGVSGYSTAQELRMYETRARDYAPDLVLLAFHTANDVADASKALDAQPMRPYFELRDGTLVLDDSFLRSDEFVRRQTVAWNIAVAVASRSRLVQLVNEFHVRRKHTVRKAKERAKAPPVGDELGISNGVYVEPPPRKWEDAWQVTDAILGRFAREVANDGAQLFVAVLSNGIQVNPDPNARRAYAHRLGVPDLDYPDRRIAAILERRGIAHIVLAPRLREEAERSGACLHGFDNAVPCAGHWNAAGHRTAGKLIGESLCQFVATRNPVITRREPAASMPAWRDWRRRPTAPKAMRRRIARCSISRRVCARSARRIRMPAYSR